MSYDTNSDEALTANELTDRRLHRIVQLADANSDGRATRSELGAYFETQAREFRFGNGPRGGSRQRPDEEGVGGRPMGRGPGGPPQPGQILPGFLQNELDLTEAQRSQLAALQQHVNAELARILTREQNQRLQRMSDRPRFGPPEGERGRGPQGRRNEGRSRPQIEN